MTICVATICDSHKAIVFAADRMIGDSKSFHVKSTIPKFLEIAPRYLVAWAGSEDSFIEIVNGLKSIEPGSIHDITQESVKLFRKETDKAKERSVLAPIGLTLEKFWQNKDCIDRDLRKELYTKLLKTEYQLELLICGVDANGAHIFHLFYPETLRYQTPVGFCAIGAGRNLSVPILADDPTTSKTVEDAIISLRKAKKAAEALPTIGPETDVRIIRTTGIEDPD